MKELQKTEEIPQGKILEYNVLDVSIVNRGAIRKRFVMKNEKGDLTMDQILKEVMELTADVGDGATLNAEQQERVNVVVKKMEEKRGNVAANEVLKRAVNCGTIEDTKEALELSYSVLKCLRVELAKEEPVEEADAQDSDKAENLEIAELKALLKKSLENQESLKEEFKAITEDTGSVGNQVATQVAKSEERSLFSNLFD